MATQCPGTICKTGDDAFVSIIDGIRKKALSHPDSPALSFLPDGKAENAELCSYSRLDMRARAIAAAIQATGQGDGEAFAAGQAGCGGERAGGRVVHGNGLWLRVWEVS